MPCSDLDRAAGAWELRVWECEVLGARMEPPGVWPNRQAARDVTRPTRHITLQLEHPLRLSPSTEAHRTEPASQQVLHQWRPRLIGDGCREGIVDTHEKKLGALGNRRSNEGTAGLVSIGADTRSMLLCRYGVVMDTVSPRIEAEVLLGSCVTQGPRATERVLTSVSGNCPSLVLSSVGFRHRQKVDETEDGHTGSRLPRRIVCPAGVPTTEDGASLVCVCRKSRPPCSHCIHRWMSAEQMQ